MSVAQSASSRLKSLWSSKLYEHSQNNLSTDWAVQALLLHLHGRLLSADQKEALHSLSPSARSNLATTASAKLAADAQGLLVTALSNLQALRQKRDSVVEALAQTSEVYVRYEECLFLLGSIVPFAIWHILQVGLEEMSDLIEASIYDDLGACRGSNPFQRLLQAIAFDTIWNTCANRAAHKLALDTVKAIEDEEEYEVAALPRLQSWLSTSLIATLTKWQVITTDISSRLEFDVQVELGRIRSRQLFDIIKDFPTSSPALEDLNVCGHQCNLQPYISQQLSQSLQARLLHPGASTRDIIQFYTHLIRALRFIDPSGVILSHVIGPVRTYLRARSDTISVIVASLLGQAGDFTLLRDMMREAGEAQGLGNADTSLAIYEDEDDGSAQSVAMNLMSNNEANRVVVIPSADEEDWTPRPIDAGPDFRQSRKSDVIAIIVSIFDDEEGFVAALEKSCAEQLVKVDGYDTSREYEINENLKKRFGDASLSRCDVMLNDVKKSQRYDRSIQSKAPTDKNAAFTALHPLILSRQFWPPMKEVTANVPAQLNSTMFGAATATPANTRTSEVAVLSGKGVKMPGQFARALEEYQDAFKTMAPMRRLRWLNARNNVKLHLEMDDGRKIREKVTPLQAAIVETAAEMCASREQPMTVSALIIDLEVEKEAIVDAIHFWIDRHILRAIDADSTSFEIVEEKGDEK